MSVAKTARKKQPLKPSMSGPGIDSVGDLSNLPNDPVASAGVIGGLLELPLDLIDEDPNQPRHADNPGFTKESLQELAATIRERHVKTPISVRPHDRAGGRYIINHGARRYRASRIAGRETIPAFIDSDYTEVDQVIENLQRNDLTPREIAEFIGRELAKGKKKRDIAKEIGKSPAFVTQHVTLLDLPDAIADVFNTGRAKDVTVINELVTAYKQGPAQVAAWLDDDSQELTRGSVKLLREFLDEKLRGEEEGRDPNTIDAFAGKADAENDEAGNGLPSSKALKTSDPEKLKKAIVLVTYDDRPARLILSRRPSAEGYAWLKDEVEGQEFEAELTQVQLVAIMDG